MANSFGSLYVGASGLKSSQNALNTTANNLANVDTKGYVRQQVLLADRSYVTFGTNAAISKQQSGLGVTIGDIVHARDIFLDKTYRTENSRSSYYATTTEVLTEIETYFQEMQGSAFQDVLTGDSGLWVAFQELAKDPSDTANQNLVIQKASLFLSSAKAVYSGLKTYQGNINTQISDQIDQVNSLAATIDSLNKQILKIESAGLETAMDLRDQRDNALDELSALGNITYKEQANGVVTVNFESVPLVDEQRSYSMGKRVDSSTGFITPYWESLYNATTGTYQDVYSSTRLVSASNKNDTGSIKALLMARGEEYYSYQDMDGLTSETYNKGIGSSAIGNVQAQLDVLVNKIVTTINDLLSPTTTTTAAITGTDEAGNTVTIPAGARILDTEKATVGSDGEFPSQELFVRTGVSRYSTVTASDGTKYYVYNEEHATDVTQQYTIEGLEINSALLEQESLLPMFSQDGSVAQELGEALATVWDEEMLTLSPDDTTPSTFGEFYEKMISAIATKGDVYGSTATNLASSVVTIENARQQVVGVSSDEELTNMIKYQNAYNAASRYINVVSEMLDTLITMMG